MSTKKQVLLTIAGMVALACLFVLAFASLQGRRATRIKASDLAPDLELPQLGAPAIKTKIRALRGGPALLVLFDSSSPTAAVELPEIERVHREFFRQGLRVVGIAVDVDQGGLKRFAERHALTFPVMVDPGGQALRASYGTPKFPEAYLINAQGKVSVVYVSSTSWRSEAVRDQIKSLLPPETGG